MADDSRTGATAVRMAIAKVMLMTDVDAFAILEIDTGAEKVATILIRKKANPILSYSLVHASWQEEGDVQVRVIELTPSASLILELALEKPEGGPWLRWDKRGFGA